MVLSQQICDIKAGQQRQQRPEQAGKVPQAIKVASNEGRHARLQGHPRGGEPGQICGACVCEGVRPGRGLDAHLHGKFIPLSALSSSPVRILPVHTSFHTSLHTCTTLHLLQLGHHLLYVVQHVQVALALEEHTVGSWLDPHQLKGVEEEGEASQRISQRRQARPASAERITEEQAWKEGKSRPDETPQLNESIRNLIAALLPSCLNVLCAMPCSRHID